MRGRYAPSPTGRFHLGNAATALLAWLQVRSQQGTFVMRVEDLDPVRSRSHWEREQLEDLKWLGLDWDEGPDIGGPHGPYRQSERFEQYEDALAKLDTYPCTCTRKEVREAALAPHGSETVYPGTCRLGPQAPDRTQRSQRWCTPSGVVKFSDQLQGEFEQAVQTEVGDFILQRTDGVWAYQLAVVWDDAQMGITHICRGADLTLSTPRQILLQRALSLPQPHYVHAPLLLGADGDKLSKRHNAPDLTTLREQGCDPKLVVASLAKLLNLIDPAIQQIGAGDLLQHFSWTQIPKGPIYCKPEILDSLRVE